MNEEFKDDYYRAEKVSNLGTRTYVLLVIGHGTRVTHATSCTSERISCP